MLTEYTIPLGHIERHIDSYVIPGACPIATFFDSLGYNATVGDQDVTFHPVGEGKWAKPLKQGTRIHVKRKNGLGEEPQQGDLEMLNEALLHNVDLVVFFDMPDYLLADSSFWRRKVVAS